MKAIQALEGFRNFIEQSGQSINQLTPEFAIDLMVDFYSQNRAEDVNLNRDGDMLLFEWGTYDWGSGESFTYNITRQFIFPETFQENDSTWEEDVFWQLTLSLVFDPADELRLLNSGEKWCEAPSDTDDFRSFISSCEVTFKIKYYSVESVNLTFGKV